MLEAGLWGLLAASALVAGAAIGLVGTGGEANLYITDGDVQVNGAVETQKRKKLRAGDEVVFQGKKIVIR